MKNVIFYFSGTGNSHWVAKEIAEQIEDCELVAISDYDIEQPICAERVGIVFPVYNVGLPNVIKKFVSKIKLEGTPYLFAFHSMGGFDGVASFQIKESIQKRGYSLNASFKVVMPHNYIIAPSVKIPEDDKIEERFTAAEKVIQEAVQHIRKKEVFFAKDSIITKLAHGKLLKTNLACKQSYPTLDKDFVVSDLCVGCGQCAKQCPSKNITMKEKRPSFGHHCEVCLKCLHRCPKKAINYKDITVEKKRYRNPKGV